MKYKVWNQECTIEEILEDPHMAESFAAICDDEVWEQYGHKIAQAVGAEPQVCLDLLNERATHTGEQRLKKEPYLDTLIDGFLTKPIAAIEILYPEVDSIGTGMEVPSTYQNKIKAKLAERGITREHIISIQSAMRDAARVSRSNEDRDLPTVLKDIASAPHIVKLAEAYAIMDKATWSHFFIEDAHLYLDTPEEFQVWIEEQHKNITEAAATYNPEHFEGRFLIYLAAHYGIDFVNDIPKEDHNALANTWDAVGMVSFQDPRDSYIAFQKLMDRIPDLVKRRDAAGWSFRFAKHAMEHKKDEKLVRASFAVADNIDVFNAYQTVHEERRHLWNGIVVNMGNPERICYIEEDILAKADKIYAVASRCNHDLHQYIKYFAGGVDAGYFEEIITKEFPRYERADALFVNRDIVFQEHWHAVENLVGFISLADFSVEEYNAIATAIDFGMTQYERDAKEEFKQAREEGNIQQWADAKVILYESVMMARTNVPLHYREIWDTLAREAGPAILRDMRLPVFTKVAQAYHYAIQVNEPEPFIENLKKVAEQGNTGRWAQTIIEYMKDNTTGGSNYRQVFERIA